MDQFKDRLKIILKDESTKAFAKKSGVQETTLRSYLYGSSLPGLDKLIAISEAALANIEWLATGRGPKNIDDRESFNPELLTIIIEALEVYEKEHDVKFQPDEKASRIALYYDLFWEEDYRTDEGKKNIREGILAFLLFLDMVDRAVETKTGQERIRKFLQKEFENNMDKEEAEIAVDDFVGGRIIDMHPKKGTLKTLNDLIKKYQGDK